MTRVLRVLPDADAVARAASERMLELARSGGSLALTGGSTPRDAYLMAGKAGEDWRRVSLWFSDERCVAPDHEYSNYGMAEAALLSQIDKAKRPQVFRIRGEDGPDPAAASYEAELRTELGEPGGPPPAIDLLMLGLGPDAHCASLFPSKPEWRERRKLAVGVDEAGMPPQVPRVSFTLTQINAAREVLFIVAGRSKAQAVERAFGPLPDLSAPAAHVDAARVTVLMDAAAAAQLPDEVAILPRGEGEGP